MTRPESYSPFNPELNEEFPIEEILPRKYRLDVLNGVPASTWNLIFINSPAQNAEAEMLMGKFVVEAVRAGEWTYLPAKKDGIAAREVSLAGGGAIYEVNSSFEKPQKILEKIGYVEKVLVDGEEMLKPTKDMLIFIKERLAPLSKGGEATI